MKLNLVMSLKTVVPTHKYLMEKGKRQCLVNLKGKQLPKYDMSTMCTYTILRTKPVLRYWENINKFVLSRKCLLIWRIWCLLYFL